MASSYRNGYRGSSSGSMKVDRPVPSSNLKASSFKSRTSTGSALRRSSPASLTTLDDGVPGRVRVAVRLRPRNAEELVADADFADCVELQPELKRLKLRKNNWDSDTYEFDEVLTEFASQKRVYEVVAKPVVESVLDGYNGTVMAYGQTGTGKTFTLGRIGEEDTSDRGIMVRSMEDIFADISPETDSISVSYLQLYMETLQDLLDPANDNIPIVEDPKTGDVSVPGATLVEIRDQQSFVELLRIGEAHRIAANTKLNTESSRSHAILMVHVRRSVTGREDIISSENGDPSHLAKPFKPLVRKSKLVVVDLAGSERVHKSGSEGHMLEEAKSINLSLSALGKCINALAENSAHVPVRDSKLTRLLRDSFGGTARTSLIVTIGPSPRHRGETASTIQFGQRAMKVENMLKIKEEFDYKSLSRRLEVQVDKLIVENERQQKAFEDEVERINVEAQNRISEVERSFTDALEKERLKCQMDYMESVKQLEEKLVLNQQKHDCDGFTDGLCNGQGSRLSVAEINNLLEKETNLRKAAEEEVEHLKSQLGQHSQLEAGGGREVLKLLKIIEDEAHQKKKLEEEIIILRSQLLQSTFEADQMRRCLERSGPGNAYTGLDSSMSPFRHSQFKDSGNGQKASIATLFEQVGLQKILALLESEDANVRIHAVKVVANLAAEDSNTYPGPFVVVDISRKSEDGLTVVVSPLIRIHNETKFSMELRFRQPRQNEDDFASVMLKTGETIDDSIAMFDAVNLSGELEKALTSLSVGNFLFSLRPKFSDGSINSKNSLSVEWSDDFKGGKAVRLSGILDQLSYRVQKALFVGSMKCSFSTACCILKSNGAHVSSMYFLIQSIGRDVPVIQPDKSKDHLKNSDSPVALQEQKEIFLLPTIKVSNLLHSEIHVLLSERDVCTTNGYNIGGQATISNCSTVDFYVNPAIIFFTITLTDFNTSCKPVNSGDWIKKLLKKKSAVHYLDIDLDFGGGKYFASLRLSRGDRGILEAAIFTSYSLKNDTDFSLYFFPPNKKPLSRDEAENFSSSISPELGLLLHPKKIGSWFLKSNKVQLKLLKDSASEQLLDLDSLSGLTEISLEVNEGSGVKSITKLGVSMGPLSHEVVLPSQIVTMVPRYIVLNESEESIIVRQCYLQDDMEGIRISSNQEITLLLQDGISKGREFNIFENFIRKHRNANLDSLKYIRFQLDEPELSWSGPVCIASLGRFFVKFRKKKSNQTTAADTHITEFAAVSVVEKGSSLVLHFQKPPDISLPYRIENGLRDVAITFYQKGSSEQEVLESGCSVDYVWDDLTLPHKLVVLIVDSLPLREINLDKVRAWKSFHKPWQHRGLASNSGDHRINNGEVTGMKMAKVGFEVYADGLTRVLRICEISSSHKGETVLKSRSKIQLRISHLAIHLLECRKQDGDESETSVNSPIIIMRLGKINMDSVFTDQHKYNQISLQSLNLEEKWVGAPFAAMLRRHLVDYSEPDDCVLKIVFVLLSSSSNVTQVKYSSIVLQPVDLNLDEETLMRIAPFWRKSLSDSKSPSRQFYFDHFEIHPIKIFANFLPGESYSSYSSAQETLRSLLHSVVKVPSLKNKVVELNGVLVTHALITMRELCIRCARHYSWYGMRAIYIAKGSSLLPPDFASMFDDLASSSLDIFFDPSRGLRNLPGLTLGTFKFISKCIDGKGFSGTKRYFGDLEKTLRTAGSNVLFAAVTEISDSVLKGAEASGFNGMVSGFHHGILKLAMEPSLLGTALMEGGPDRKIKLDHSPGVDELYIEGYLQAMLDTLYRQEYLRVKVIDNQVFLKNLPPNSSLIEEIMDHVKAFLISKALLKGDSSTTSRPLHHLRGEREWKIGPTVLTLCEHLFVSFAIRALRKQANKYIANIKWKRESDDDNQKAIVLAKPKADKHRLKFIWKWGIGKFVLSGIVAYVDGRLCRCIPNPVARRIVSGFLLSFLDNNSKE